MSDPTASPQDYIWPRKPATFSGILEEVALFLDWLDDEWPHRTDRSIQASVRNAAAFFEAVETGVRNA